MPFCLNIHAEYRCRHAGACCTQDWHIPVERAVVQLVGALGLGPRGRPAFVADATGVPRTLARHDGGACVFFEADDGRLCAIHRAAGPDALPSACRHFPRVVLHDDRGTFIGLSHYCPTAAAMLLEPIAPRVVEAPASLSLPDLEGFEARAVLPPLLRPGVLTDLAGYHAWETMALLALARPRCDPEEALGTIAGATAQARTWRPGSSALEDWIGKAFEASASATADCFDARDQQRRAAVLTAMSGTRVPGYAADDPGLWAAGRTALAPFARASCNYLAGRLFANHLAYQGEGLLTVVEWLRTCLAVLQREAARQHAAAGRFTEREFVEAVRQSDLALVHQADTRAFARRAVRTIEGATP